MSELPVLVLQNTAMYTWGEGVILRLVPYLGEQRQELGGWVLGLDWTRDKAALGFLGTAVHSMGW